MHFAGKYHTCLSFRRRIFALKSNLTRQITSNQPLKLICSQRIENKQLPKVECLHASLLHSNKVSNIPVCMGLLRLICCKNEQTVFNFNLHIYRFNSIWMLTPLSHLIHNNLSSIDDDTLANCIEYNRNKVGLRNEQTIDK